MFSKLLDVLNDLRPRQLMLLAGATALLMFVVVYFALTGLTEKKEMTVTAPVLILVLPSFKSLLIVRMMSQYQ